MRLVRRPICFELLLAVGVSRAGAPSSPRGNLALGSCACMFTWQSTKRVYKEQTALHAHPSSACISACSYSSIDSIHGAAERLLA